VCNLGGYLLDSEDAASCKATAEVLNAAADAYEDGIFEDCERTTQTSTQTSTGTSTLTTSETTTTTATSSETSTRTSTATTTTSATTTPTTTTTTPTSTATTTTTATTTVTTTGMHAKLVCQEHDGITYYGIASNGDCKTQTTELNKLLTGCSNSEALLECGPKIGGVAILQQAAGCDDSAATINKLVKEYSRGEVTADSACVRVLCVCVCIFH